MNERKRKLKEMVDRYWKEHPPEKYDELCKAVNDAYRENPDIQIRTLANNLGVPFDVVWECIGFKDWFAFYDTVKD